jgi:hypothetical protein
VTFADDLVARFEPWLTPDLETYLRAIAGMMSQVELYALDSDDAEGWTILFDPDLCPVEGLPYLAQYVGEVLRTGATEAEMRTQIKEAPNQQRGTNPSIFAAAQRRLTGAKLVAMTERDGTVDTLTVVTYQDQTPNPNGTQADIMAVLPADVILNYQNLPGQRWSNVKASYATWTALKTANATWGLLASAQGGSATYVPPRIGIP